MAVYPIPLPNRGFLRLRGSDKHFLQGIISQDIELLQTQPCIYACLLTPQGKFLHDFFVINLGEDWLIDGEADRLEDLQKRLTQFRMRHKVEIINAREQWQVIAVLPEAAPFDLLGEIVSDPRHAEMGQRVYIAKDAELPLISAFNLYDVRRLKLGIPDGSRDIVVEQALPMEFRLHALNGISLSKGCYLGQEMCSRMFFRDLLKRQTYTIQFDGDAPPAGTIIANVTGQIIGELRSSAGRLALAVIKIEAVEKAEALFANGQPCQIFTESH